MFRSRRARIDKLSFIIAGAQKSGTTALRYFLEKHPRITLGDQPEMHFFDNDELFAQPPVDYELLHRHFRPVAASVVAGECSPSYLYWRPAAERICEYNPGIKLVVVLRDPVERAFAHWNMQRFKGREPLDFLEAIKEEKVRLTGAPPLEARRYAYVDRGFYAQQLGRFFQFFPREQVCVLKFEEFKSNQPKTLGTVFSFLGVETIKVRNKDRNVVPYMRAINQEERMFLYDVFAEEIARLEKMLGWNCSDWKV